MRFGSRRREYFRKEIANVGIGPVQHKSSRLLIRKLAFPTLDTLRNLISDANDGNAQFLQNLREAFLA